MKLYNKKEYPILALLIVINIVTIGLQIILALLSRYLIDEVIKSRSIEKLNGWIIISFITYCIYHMLNAYGLNYFKFKYFLKKSREFTNNLLVECLKKPIYKFKNFNDGYLINILISDVCTVAEISVQKIVEYTTLTIGICISLVLLINISYLSFIIVIGSIPIYIISTNIFKPKLTKHEASQKIIHDATMLELQNIIINKKSIKLAKKETYFTKIFYKIYSDWLKYRLRFWKLHFFATETPKFISSIVVIVIFYILTLAIFNNTGTIGELVFVQAILVNMFNFINRILDIYIRSKVAKVAEQRVNELYKNSTDVFLGEKIDRGLELKNIDISIEDRLLYHINNMYIKDKGIYIIEGENGTGKSTLFNILMSILLPIKKTPNSIIKVSDDILNASYLSSPYIFINDTVKNNILLGDEEKLIYNELLNLLGINIENKIVEVGGKNLSYGEQQKIALARILHEDANVLILDEPYVNLDIETKNRLIKYIDSIKNEKIIFIISHDDIIKKSANSIYRIQDKLLQRKS